MEPIRGIKQITDPNYRYQMHRMIFQKDKEKLHIKNLDVICTDLHIPGPDIVVGFIKKRLSVQIIEKNNQIFASAKTDQQIIQDALYEFIEYFVLCTKCKLPELSYILDNKKLITICSACGKNNQIVSNNVTDKTIKLFEKKLAL
jgi:translation initiation factor 2 beta subunit (eIF-2beta)/eIF-5